MAAEPKRIRVTPGSDLTELLDRAAGAPLLLEHEGVVFRLSREDEDITAGYDPDPELVRRTLAATVGSWSDLDPDQVIKDLYEARRAGSRPPERP